MNMFKSQLSKVHIGFNNGVLMVLVGICFVVGSLSIDKFVKFQLLDMYSLGWLFQLLGAGFIMGWVGYRSGVKDTLSKYKINTSNKRSKVRKSRKTKNTKLDKPDTSDRIAA